MLPSASNESVTGLWAVAQLAVHGITLKSAPPAPWPIIRETSSARALVEAWHGSRECFYLSKGNAPLALIDPAALSTWDYSSDIWAPCVCAVSFAPEMSAELLNLTDHITVLAAADRLLHPIRHGQDQLTAREALLGKLLTQAPWELPAIAPQGTDPATFTALATALSAAMAELAVAIAAATNESAPAPAVELGAALADTTEGLRAAPVRLCAELLLTTATYDALPPQVRDLICRIRVVRIDESSWEMWLKQVRNGRADTSQPAGDPEQELLWSQELLTMTAELALEEDQLVVLRSIDDIIDLCLNGPGNPIGEILTLIKDSTVFGWLAGQRKGTVPIMKVDAISAYVLMILERRHGAWLGAAAPDVTMETVELAALLVQQDSESWGDHPKANALVIARGIMAGAPDRPGDLELGRHLLPAA